VFQGTCTFRYGFPTRPPEYSSLIRNRHNLSTPRSLYFAPLYRTIINHIDPRGNLCGAILNIPACLDYNNISDKIKYPQGQGFRNVCRQQRKAQGICRNPQ
jgi:hypothetical protein